MLSIFGVNVVVYFIKLLSGCHNYYLDMSRAFDKVSYKDPFHRLCEYGFSGIFFNHIYKIAVNKQLFSVLRHQLVW